MDILCFTFGRLTHYLLESGNRTYSKYLNPFDSKNLICKTSFSSNFLMPDRLTGANF